MGTPLNMCIPLAPLRSAKGEGAYGMYSPFKRGRDGGFPSKGGGMDSMDSRLRGNDEVCASVSIWLLDTAHERL